MTHIDPAPPAAPAPPARPDPQDVHDEAPPLGARAMAIVRWLLVAVMAVIAFAALEHRHGWLRGGDRSTRAAAIYHCPMHPAVQQDHPGECPICGMSLVPRPAQVAPAATADAAAPHASGQVPGLAPVTLTPERIQLMGMATATVTRGALAPSLRTTGTVAASERGLAVIPTRFAGWIEQLRVEQTGQRVTRGQVLATVYSPELLAAQHEHLSAMRWGQEPAGGAMAGLREDSRHRLELLGIAATEIDELERTGQPLHAMPIRSPVTGYITDKAAVRGLYVQPGAPLFQVADLSTVWILADIDEHELARVQVGQATSLEVPAYPGETFTGVVAFLNPSLDPGTRTLRVRIELRNPGLRLKPGMFGTVHLQLAPAQALIIPAEALVDTGALQYVFVARSGGRFEPRRVKVGARAGGRVEILDGVAEGEAVVTTANFLLDSESHLQATLTGAAESPRP